MHLPHSKKCNKSQKISVFGARKNFLHEFFYLYPPPPPGVPPEKKCHGGTRNFFSGGPLVAGLLGTRRCLKFDEAVLASAMDAAHPGAMHVHPRW